jgi:hypothetical protein
MKIHTSRGPFGTRYVKVLAWGAERRVYTRPLIHEIDPGGEMEIEALEAHLAKAVERIQRETGWEPLPMVGHYTTEAEALQAARDHYETQVTEAQAEYVQEFGTTDGLFWDGPNMVLGGRTTEETLLWSRSYRVAQREIRVRAS